MNKKCTGFILIREYPNSKKFGYFEPFTTGEFLKFPDIWKPVYESIESTEDDFNPIKDVLDYSDILKRLRVDDRQDKLSIVGFDEEDHEFVRNLIRKVRISKVYNEKKKTFKAGECRWYNWYKLDSSGFAFNASSYDFSLANTGSASRLCFAEKSCAEDVAKKFKSIDERFCDIKL